MDGVSHTVEITAATLYEAVAQGLAAIRASESENPGERIRTDTTPIEDVECGKGGKGRRK